MRLGSLKSTRWATYGRPAHVTGQHFGQVPDSVTQDFDTEEAAIVHIAKCALLAGDLDAVVVRIDKYRLEFDPGEPRVGQYKDVCTVTLRLGKGVGWWEGRPDDTARSK